jgi:hypothetical protein
MTPAPRPLAAELATPLTRTALAAQLAEVFIRELDRLRSHRSTPSDVVAAATLAVLDAYDFARRHEDLGGVLSKLCAAAERRAAAKHARVNDLDLRRCMLTVYRVAQAHGVSVEDLMGKGRVAGISQVRQAAMVAAREGGFSYPVIGVVLDRDHSTVIAGVRSAAKRDWAAAFVAKRDAARAASAVVAP